MLISVDVPLEMKSRLDDMKAQTGLSLSDLVRLMLAKQLESPEPVTIDFSKVAP